MFDDQCVFVLMWVKEIREQNFSSSSGWLKLRGNYHLSRELELTKIVTQKEREEFKKFS